MRDDYKITTDTAKLEISIEKDILDKLNQMEKHTGLTKSELTNTALKRFITAHNDFMPPRDPKAKLK